MASVSNVSLSIGSGSSPTARSVKVTGTLNFDPSDVGKGFRLQIKLFGEDRPDDDLDAGDAPGDDELYTFRWPPPFPLLNFTIVNAMSAGSQGFTEARSILSEALDEDPGDIGDQDMPRPILKPRVDEIYARVVLTREVSARSPTVIAHLG